MLQIRFYLQFKTSDTCWHTYTQTCTQRTFIRSWEQNGIIPDGKQTKTTTTKEGNDRNTNKKPIVATVGCLGGGMILLSVGLSPL